VAYKFCCIYKEKIVEVYEHTNGDTKIMLENSLLFTVSCPERDPFGKTIGMYVKVTGELADKPTRGQSSRGLDNSRTGQLAEMFDLKFGVYNNSECYFGQITLFIRCQHPFDRVRVKDRVRFNVQIKYSNSMIFKNSLSAS